MKRSKGEGAVYKRKDGSWCAQYHDGNKRRYIYGKKKQMVTDRLRNALVALENGTVFDPEPMEVGEYLTYWLSSVDGTVRDRTLQRYEGLVRNHLTPEIGEIMLGKLTSSDIQGLYQKKLKEGLSPRSVEYIHITINRPSLRPSSGRRSRVTWPRSSSLPSP